MLQVTVSNNIRLRGVTTPLRAAITAALTMPNPAHEKLKRMRKPTYGIDKDLKLYIYDSDGTLVTPRGFIHELRDILKAQGYSDSVISYVNVEQMPVDFGPWQGWVLRDYQQPAVADATKKGGVLVAPAGSGKTLMGLAVVMAWQQPTLWLTHTLDLLDQSARAAEAMLGGVGKVGRIGDGKVEWGSGKLIVATVQTLNANPTLVATLNSIIGAVVVDEAHHFPAQQFIEVAGKFTAARMLGLTATPDRKDGLQRLMYLGLGPMCHEVKRDGMYEAGAIILPEVRFVFTEFGKASGYSEVDLEAGEAPADNVDAGGEDLDYGALFKELTEDQGRAKLIAENVLESVVEIAPKGGAVIVLADQVRYLFQLRDLVERFAKVRLGIIPRMAVVHGGLTQYTWKKTTKAQAKRLERDGHTVRENERLGRWEVKTEAYTDAEMRDWQVSSQQRRDAIEAARDRGIDIIFATSQLVKEGLDIPNLYHGHLATPQRGDSGAKGSRSGGGVEQAIGRIMRADPKNKDKQARWYDYVDFNVGVFADQYYSRRSVYKRLGISLPVRKKTKTKLVEDFLINGGPFSGGLPL